MSLTIQWKRITPTATLPTQGKVGDAAFDIYSDDEFVLESHETKVVNTGLVLADMPAQYKGNSIFLQIEGRSGLASKGIIPLGGIIDANYRGEVKIILHNLSSVPRTFKLGDRIAQVIIRQIVTNDHDNSVCHVESFRVTQSTRGQDGFGSTGI